MTQRVQKTGFYRPVEELPVNWDLFEPRPDEDWEEGNLIRKPESSTKRLEPAFKV